MKENLDEAIFARAVYIYPYKSNELLNSLHRTIEEINLEGIGESENVWVLNTKVLSDTEWLDWKLDIIGGFEFIDSEYWILVIEGLGAPGKGMDWFY